MSWRFFYKHAGYSYPSGSGPIAIHRERVCNALQLEAAIKRYHATEDVFFSWEEDPEPYDPMDAKNPDGTPYTPREVFCLMMYQQMYGEGGYESGVRLKDKVLGCLCGIADPDYNQRKVYEAEMALEAWKEIDAKAGD